MRRTALVLALLAPFAASAAVLEAPSLSVPKISGLPAVGAASALPNFAVSAGAMPVFSGASALVPSLPGGVLAAPVLPVAAVAAPVARSAVASNLTPDARAAALFKTLPGRVAETVSGWSLPVETLLADHEVLLVGESHGSLSSLRALTEQMPRLAKAGVGAVGLEGLKAPQQKAVDEWLASGGEIPEEALSFSPSRRAELIKLYEAARRHGVRVVALGLPLEEWAGQVTALLDERGVEVDAAVPRDLPGQVDLANEGYYPRYNEIVAEVALARRNRSMAARLRDALPAGVKGVAVVGSMHVEGLDDLPGRLFRVRGDYGHMARELAYLGLKAFSLNFLGGEYSDGSRKEQDRRTRIRSYAAAGQGGYTPLDGSKGVYKDPFR